MSFTKSTPPDMPRGQAENCSLLKLYSFSIYRIVRVSDNSLSSLSTDLGDFYRKFLECSEKIKILFFGLPQFEIFTLHGKWREKVRSKLYSVSNASSGCDLSYGDHSGRALRRSSDPAESADNELGQISGSVTNLPDSVPVTISLGVKTPFVSISVSGESSYKKYYRHLS